MDILNSHIVNTLIFNVIYIKHRVISLMYFYVLSYIRFVSV